MYLAVFNGLYKSFKEIQSLESIRAIVLRGIVASSAWFKYNYTEIFKDEVD
jgi:hypothetical protein